MDGVMFAGRMAYVKKSGRNWYICDRSELIGNWSCKYLHKDGTWHGYCGHENLWHTQEEAMAFLCQVPHTPEYDEFDQSE